MSTTGFTLSKKRHGPHDPDRLGFWFYDEKNQHRGVEFAITDSHPLMVVHDLMHMAARIEELYRESMPTKKRRPQPKE